MRVGVVDIGTNSMRLLVTDGVNEVVREVEVTGLGQGVDASGRLADEAMARTLEVLGRYGAQMESVGVDSRKAIATSASRDAKNSEEFFDLAEVALGIRPTLLSGDQEARFSFDGATLGRTDSAHIVVSDIGGGSTEFVSVDHSLSIDVGSVRLTEKTLPDRPATTSQVRRARQEVVRLFAEVHEEVVSVVLGVAGTWTSLGAMALGLKRYRRDAVDGSRLGKDQLDGLVEQLARMTVEETAAIPSMDPKRAPVILAGSVIASEVLAVLGTTEIEISESDSLDGVAARLLAIA